MLKNFEELWKTLLNSVEIKTSLSGGPGGQHAQKSQTKVTLSVLFEKLEELNSEVASRFKEKFPQYLKSHLIQITRQDQRSQKQNKEKCFKTLKDLLKKSFHPPKKRKKTNIPKSVKKKRETSKRLNSLKKELRGKVRF